MNRTAVIVTSFALWSTGVQADTSLAIGVDLDDATLTTLRYECGDAKPFTVLYANSGNNILAFVPVDGDERIFVNVVAASGSRYVAGQHEWWIKGENATLTDLVTEEARQCVVSSQ